MSSFCRHNRFISECPICAKGTVLDPGRKEQRRPASSGATSRTSKRRPSSAAVAKPARGPYAAAGPYGNRELRLERVPGGLRLASWLGGQLERSAPVLVESDLPGLVAVAIEKQLFGPAEAETLRAALELGHPDDDAGAPDEQAAVGSAEAGYAPTVGSTATRGYGRSPGRSGELRDELRVESLEDGELRIARWLLRPNRGWELQEAPVLLPAARFAQALADAARQGVLAPGQPTA